MIDVTNLTEWPKRVEPEGWEHGNQPPFDEWWARSAVVDALTHLGSQVGEQWPYRHWNHSPYSGIPFNELSVNRILWPTSRILGDIFVGDRAAVQADNDYRVFYLERFLNSPPLEPGRRMLAEGTWKTPVLVLKTPTGLTHWEGIFPQVRYLLIEGHSRHRCLNAIASRDEAAEYHEVLLLNWNFGTSLIC